MGVKLGPARGALVLVVAIAAAATLAACDTGGSDEASMPDGVVDVTDAWARPAAAGDNSAAYMTVRNGTDADDTLIEARFDGAAMVQLHESFMDGDVARMQHLPDGIPLPAGAAVELAPEGLHVMLMNLQRDLEEGQTAAITLVLASGTELAVDAEVRQTPSTE
jgi:copper(I)-binding protein